jgi:copper transport protein
MTRSRAVAALAGLIFGLLVVLASPASPATAHAGLLEVQPQAGAVLAQPPTEVVLTFSEPVRIIPGKIHIISPDGRAVEGGKPTSVGVKLHIPMKATTERGTYLTSFRVISADSHPISGGIPFSIGAPSANAPTQSTGGAPTDRLVSSLLGSARYLGYAGLVLVVGPALFLSALWPRRLSRRGPIRMIMFGIGLLAVSTLAELYLEAPYHAGAGLFGARASDLRDVFNSQFGAAHLVRIGVIAALAVLLPLFVNRPADADATDHTDVGVSWSDRALVAILAVVGLATWPISGHPASTSVPVLTTVADAAHLGAMSVWLGGLVVLFGFLLRRANPRELAAVLPVWSGWAAKAVVVLVTAGVAQAVISLNSVRGLYATTYGRLLLGKVAILMLVLGVAWFSRRLTLGPLRGGDAMAGTARHDMVEQKDPSAEGTTATGSRATKPKAAGGGIRAAATRTRTPVTATVDTGGSPPADGSSGTDPARRRLRRLVGVELLGTLVVLGLTSVLVQTTPARAAQEDAARRDNTSYSATLKTRLYSLQVQIDPKRTGVNTVHLYAFTPNGGASLSIKEWKATAALPSAGIEPVDLPVLPITDDHAVSQAQLPRTGTWELRFTLRTSDVDAATVVAKVQIS